MAISNREGFLEESTILISHLDDQSESFRLDVSTPWVGKILDKLTAEIDPDAPQVKKLDVNIHLKRDTDSTYGEYLYVEGDISGSYIASCIRCLIDTPQTFSKEFKGAFINGRLENDPEYEEIDEIFINNEQADLFFHQRGKADLNEVVFEACFLAVNHYPLHDEDCKGLCHTCGANLNTDTCKH